MYVQYLTVHRNKMIIVLLVYLLVLPFKRGYSAVLRDVTIAKDKDVLLKMCYGLENGFYPHPTNCSLYISCNGNGKSEVKKCEANNHFHPDYKVCVWEQIYPCSGLISNGIKRIVSYCKRKDEGVYKDTERCDRYVICSKEGAYHMKCPPNNLFNSITSRCEKKENVPCVGQTRITPTSSHDISTESRIMPTRKPTSPRSSVQMKLVIAINYSLPEAAKTSFSCREMDVGKYAVKDACQYYYLCADEGNAKLKKCPKHKNFHPVYRSCVWTYLYSCDDPNFCERKKDGKYQNINNCYGYYHCSGGRTFPRNCEPGWRFNGNHCVDAAQYICPKSDISVKVI